MQLVNRLRFDNLRGDLFDVTAAIVALPLALAFGVASGVGAIAGLYKAIFTGFFAALFGGTPSLTRVGFLQRCEQRLKEEVKVK